MKCSEHVHDACWLFEADVPVSERFNKLPVTFTTLKKAKKYADWLISYDPQYLGVTIERTLVS